MENERMQITSEGLAEIIWSLEFLAENIGDHPVLLPNGAGGYAAPITGAGPMLQRAVETIRALQEALAEARYTEPAERWVATRIELEGQDDVGSALAYPRSDGDPGFVVEVTLYKEDGDAEGTGTGSDLREAFADAIRAAEGAKEADDADEVAE